MKKLLIYIMAAIMSVSAVAQEPAETFHRSRGQKAVATSTDVLLVALPAAALTTVLVQKDWKGLVQGAETAGATLAATFIPVSYTHLTLPTIYSV